MAKCKMANCNEDMHYMHLEVCKACYSGLSYWKGRPRAHKEKRLEQLKRLNGRMEFMIDNPRSVPHRRRK